MGRTQRRIEARRVRQAARASIVAQNHAEAVSRHIRQQARGFAPAQFGDDPWYSSDHDYETPDFQTGEMILRWKRDDQDVWGTGFRGELAYDGVGLIGSPARETRSGKLVTAITPAQQASALREEQFRQATKARGAAHFRTMSYSETQAMLSRYGTNAAHDLGHARKPKAKHTHCKEEACGCLLSERELRAQGYTSEQIEQIRQAHSVANLEQAG